MSVSIVIQGPLHEHSLSHLEDYSQYGQVILSHWRNDVYKLNTPIAVHSVTENTTTPKDVIVSAIDLPKLDGIDNVQNKYYQFCSTLNGLEHVKTDHVIKLRSDEYYNLLPLISLMNNNPDKLITSNLFVRRFHQFPFHISDHVICGRTDRLLKTFRECKRICESKTEQVGSCLSVEQLIGFVYFHDVIQSKNLSNDWDIIDVRKMKPFCYATGNIYHTTDEANPNGAVEITSVWQI